MKFIWILFAAAALAACSKRDPVADEANRVAGLPAVNEPAAAAAGEPRAGAAALPADAAPPSDPAPGTGPAIPAALRGRWALTPGDCTSTRGDAKGLLTIGPDSLRFYESRAVPGPNVQADADSISGDFAFVGEGQSWTKYVTLQLQRRKLVRTETNPSVSFYYAKCD